MSITYKTIKFEPRLIPEILADRKTTTVRIESEMQNSIYAGDTVFLLDSYQKKPFALAEITSVEKKRFDEFDEKDKSTSKIPDVFKKFKEMMQKYYTTHITEETVWSVIHFRITDDGQKRELIEMLEVVSTEKEEKK